MANEQKKEITEYVLRNTTTSDINLGDLRYTIPAKQARNLLSKTAHLNYNDVMKSKESGSIAKRLGKSLIEVTSVITTKLPKKQVASPSVVQFPQRTKSSIVIDVNEIFQEELQTQVLNEEEMILKELEQSYEDSVAPVIAKKEDEKEEKTKA